MKRTIIAILGLAVFTWAGLSETPFCNKLIFSETPEIGKKWRGGIRMTDFVIWDGYFNIYDWMLFDFVRGGLKGMKIDETSEMDDYFYSITFKSRPFGHTLGGGDYKAAAGIKFFKAPFVLRTEEDSISMRDSSTVFFLTQSYLFRQKHLFNLFTSISSRGRENSKGEKISSTTYYIVPGYSIPIYGNWSFAVEYYMSNTEKLPLKILQFAFDEDKLDFLNSSKEMYSWMFYGVRYTGKHLRVDLNMANHITFSGLIMPLFGVGWNF